MWQDFENRATAFPTELMNFLATFEEPPKQRLHQRQARASVWGADANEARPVACRVVSIFEVVEFDLDALPFRTSRALATSGCR
jgi:hypothetical protein